jgi:dTDP-4-dehydrorhamnose reductase|tara:strand:+ start:109 stop:873 length:765 start_codon:yes stop_codon:yes gene_type:complete
MRLIIGGDSTIGSALFREWKRFGIPTCASTRRKHLIEASRPLIDYSRPDELSLSESYSSATICAGTTKISECEQNPIQSHRCNVSAPVEIAKKLSSKGSYILYLSSSQVFDGSKPLRSPSEKVCPINEYGRQKVVAEREILRLGNAAVLRITKILSSHSSLVQKWKHRLENGHSIFPYSNVVISPVSIEQVISQITNLISLESTGIWHLGGGRDVSYADYALEKCRIWNLDESLIKPETSPEYSGIHYSSLSSV